MQEIHSIGGTRFFSAGTGDRRLRPHNHPNNNNHQALKCPRCDSVNTKFCYYNNYNLSQPRHFCKNCRRYWTKGGVLRNVPVGGGCRKSKRSNNKSKTSSSTSNAAPDLPELPEPEHKSNSHSSSESSSLTATTAATEAVSAPTLNSDANYNVVENIQESKLLISSTNSALESDGIFSEIGTFSNLIASTNEVLAFGFGNSIPDTSSFLWQNQKIMNRHEEELKLTENLGTGSLLDHGVDLSALQSKTENEEFGSLDWNGGADHQGLFDLPNTVDQAYWSQTHWSDQDHSTLFHLP